MSQRVTPEHLEENAHFREGAAPGAENGLIDPDLWTIIEWWPDLPEAVKAGIGAMVNAQPSS